MSFRADPRDVLKGVSDLNPVDLVVVARSANGRVTVFGSGPSDDVLRLLDQGKARIDELTE